MCSEAWDFPQGRFHHLNERAKVQLDPAAQWRIRDFIRQGHYVDVVA
jgi:hypothetical protein